LTTDAFRAKAADLIEHGFTPASLTVCPWDGAVRYSSIWIKEPPKPVDFPKQARIIAQAGWETLVDASKDEMEEWLGARKQAKHSVVWLDSVLVAGRPLFSAIAALDDRQPDWIALLEFPTIGFTKAISQAIDVEKHRPLSASGFAVDGAGKSTMLWVPESRLFVILPDATRVQLQQGRDMANEGAAVERVLRPYPVGGNDILTAWYAERALGEQSAYIADVSEAQMAEFVQARRAAGDWITSFVAYPKSDQILYAVVAATNTQKTDWQLEFNLTSEQFQAKNEQLAAQGFRPARVTACPWDGAVRYAVIWVK
jgi:hypothetical protein